MKQPSVHIFFCAMFIAQIRYLIRTENVPPSSHSLMSQQQQLQQLRRHPTMSCYACSTMDYESSTENICRTLKPHARSPMNSYQQSNTGHLHFTHMPSAPRTTTTTTTESNQYDQSSLPTMEALVAASDGYDESATSGTTSASNYSPGEHLGADSTNVNAASGVTPTVNAHHHQSSTTSPSLVGHRRIIQNRTILHKNDIRTRPCMEDENFCSIVSVVRIEFVQDNIYSKFWALERNCSKSCNTGCMVIGERVRLRVCSQCCRTPDCNFGSGAHRSLVLNQVYLLMIALAGLLVTRQLSSRCSRDQVGAHPTEVTC